MLFVCTDFKFTARGLSLFLAPSSETYVMTWAHISGWGNINASSGTGSQGFNVCTNQGFVLTNVWSQAAQSIEPWRRPGGYLRCVSSGAQNLIYVNITGRASAFKSGFSCESSAEPDSDIISWQRAPKERCIISTLMCPYINFSQTLIKWSYTVRTPLWPR